MTDYDYNFQKRFSDCGVAFQYPDDWEIDVQTQEGQKIVTLYSPETPFMNVFIIEDRPSLDDLLDSAIDAFKSEYDEVDIYPRSEIRRIEHITTVQQQLEFVTHDLVSQVHLFGYRTGRVGVLLMYQGYDEDMKLYQNMLEAIRNTMTIEFGDQDIIT